MFQRRFSRAKFLAALAAAGLILGGSAVVAYKARRHILGHRALRAGQAALERQDWASASDQLKQYLWRYPDDEAILETYAETSLDVRPREDQYVAAAEQALRRLFQNRPGDAELAARLARLYFASRNYAEAAYVCRQRLAADSGDVDATVYLARSLIARRRHDAARKLLKNFVAEHETAASPYLMLSSNAWQEQSGSAAEEAREWLDLAVRYASEQAGPFVRRAAFLRAVERNHEAARGDLDRAHSLEPTDITTLLLLAEQWLEYEQWDRLAECMARLEVCPPDPLAKYARHPDVDVARVRRLEASLHLGRGEYDAAAAVVDRALEELAEPYRGRFLTDAIDVYIASGRLEQARVCISELAEVLDEEAGPRAPQRDHLDWHSARLARAEGRLHVAIAHLQELLERSPANASAWLELADVFDETGQWRPTGWALEQYLLRAPHDFDATLRLARTYRGRSPALAARFASDAEKLQPDNLEAALIRVEAVLDLAADGTPDPSRLDRLEQRLDLLRQAHRDNAQVLVLQARLSALGGADLSDCLKLLDGARQFDPARRDLDALHAEWLWQAGGNADARFFLSERVNRHDDFDAYRLRAEYHVRAGDVSAAERDFLHLTTIPGREADGFFQLGRFYERNYRQDEAVAAFRRGLDFDSSRVDVRLRLADSLVRSCDFAAREQGLERLDALLAEHPVLVEAIVLKARSLLDAASPHRRDQAKTLLEQAVRIDPRCAAAHVLLIGHAAAHGETEEAEALLARALSADSDSADLLVQQARLHDVVGHDGVADELARQTLQTHPNSPAVHTLLADLALRRGDPARARRLVRRTLELDPDNETAVLLLADIHTAQAQAAQAESHLVTYLSRQPGCRSVNARVKLASLYLRRGDLASAESLIREAFVIAPANIDVLRSRIQWLVDSNRIEQLRVDLAALELDLRQRAGLYTDAASAMIDCGVQLEVAAELLDAAAGMDARQDRAELLLARLHQMLGRHAEAEAVLRRVLDRNPYQRDGLRDLVTNYVEQERFSEALALADRALARYPADAELLAMRGGILLQLGRLDGAEADLGRCLRHAVLNPRLRAAAMIDLGDVYLRRGDAKRAGESFQQALAIDADHAVLTDAQRDRIRRLIDTD